MEESNNTQRPSDAMPKSNTRLIIIIVAAVVCVGAIIGLIIGLTGDGGKNGPKHQGAVENWSELDFSDVTIKIAYSEVVNSDIESLGATNSLKYLRGPDENEESELQRTDYLVARDRHEAVCEALDLKMGENLQYQLIGWTDKDCEKILGQIQALNDADDGTTIMMHQNYGMVRAGIVGEFFNALTTEYDNYFDLDNEHWYRDMMEENTLDKSKIYMLMGDYFIDQFRMSFGILANKDIADEVLKDAGGIDHLYNLVEQGSWTYDEMMSIAELAYSGEYASEFVMGAIGTQGWVVRSFFAASGLDIFKRDPATGEVFYKEGEEIDDVVKFINKLKAMEKEAYYTYNWTSTHKMNTNKSNVPTTFMNGGALFALNQMVLSFEGAQFKEMNNTATILPTPKYFDDGIAEYGALVSDNAISGGIMITAVEQFPAASAFLQMMTEESDEFFEAYYEKGLKSKNNQIGPRHNAMLDKIHEGICSPMSFLYDNYCAKSLGDTDTYKTYGAMIYDDIDNSKGFSGQWESQLGAKKNQWALIKQTFGKSAPQ